VVGQLSEKGFLQPISYDVNHGQIVRILSAGIEEVEDGGQTGHVEKLYTQYVQNVTVHGGHGVQVTQGGSPSQTNITYNQILQHLAAQIDADPNIPPEEKSSLKSAIQKVAAHPLTQTLVNVAVQVGSVIAKGG